MIFPIRCFSCGKPIYQYWKDYQMLSKIKNKKIALDELKITRYCCRTIFLTHVDIISNILKYGENIK